MAEHHSIVLLRMGTRGGKKIAWGPGGTTPISTVKITIAKCDSIVPL